MASQSTASSIRPAEARDFVATRLYKNEDEVMRDALRYLLRARPEARLLLAAHRYQAEDLSLAKAAELAGVSWQQMKDYLVERGIGVCLGTESAEDTFRDAQAGRAALTSL